MAGPVRPDETQTSMRSGSTPVIACQVSVRLRPGSAGWPVAARSHRACRASQPHGQAAAARYCAVPREWDACPAHAGLGPACGSPGRSSGAATRSPRAARRSSYTSRQDWIDRSRSQTFSREARRLSGPRWKFVGGGLGYAASKRMGCEAGTGTVGGSGMRARWRSRSAVV